MFTVTSYNGMHRFDYATFHGALAAAQRFASVGDLPSTITDRHGCRWVVWSGSQPELRDCPAAPARCDCAEVYA